MTFTARPVSCQTNLSTGRWTCTAIIDTAADPTSGRGPRTWLVIFEPATHPDSLCIMTGIIERDGVLQITILDLEAVNEGVTVMPNARGLMASWLPSIAQNYLADQEERLRAYAASYASRNAAEARPDVKWRREELIADAETELALLDRLRSHLPSRCTNPTSL